MAQQMFDPDTILFVPGKDIYFILIWWDVL